MLPLNDARGTDSCAPARACYTCATPGPLAIRFCLVLLCLEDYFVWDRGHGGASILPLLGLLHVLQAEGLE